VVSNPALHPDGARMYFATNAGTGAGAAGNCTWAFFACHTAGGRLAILSKVGAQYSRVPHWLAVSPNGRQLAWLDSLHNNNADNPCGLHVSELATQSSRELLWAGHDAQKETVLARRACWSRDSRYLAVALTWYDPAKALKEAQFAHEPDEFRTVIYDVTSAKVVCSVPGATMPSWGE
jgi:hypothetical protein